MDKDQLSIKIKDFLDHLWRLITQYQNVNYKNPKAIYFGRKEAYLLKSSSLFLHENMDTNQPQTIWGIPIYFTNKQSGLDIQ